MNPADGTIRELSDLEQELSELGDKLADGYVVVSDKVKRMHEELDELREQRREWRKAERLRR